MTIADLLALAAKATPWTGLGKLRLSMHDMDCEYLSACSPEVVAALCRVAMAANAVTDHDSEHGGKHGHEPWRALDDALDALDAALAGKGE